jgi:DNA-binding MarR family transcriptional regulator
MESEYQILTHLQENEITSQRIIAQRTGLSLGAVNILIKKMARKGLVKIEKLNSRNMRYILTPKGLQEKASLTYSYIRQSYRQLLKIHQVLDELIAAKAPFSNGETIKLAGPMDEICEILTQHLKEKNISHQHIDDQQSISKDLLADPREHPLIITWREEEEQTLADLPHSINVMKLL